MQFNFRVVPPQLSLLIGGLLGALLIAVVSLPSLFEDKEALFNQYGESLALLSANHAAEAFPSQNQVELRLILSELKKIPSVEVATIHDIENHLLAQAGKHAESDDLINFTSPIVIHDSIAGYLTVTLNKSDYGNQPVLQRVFVVIGTLLILIVWLTIKTNFIEIHRTPKPETNHISEIEEQENDSQLPEEEMTASPKVYAVIQIKNLGVLNQQLNHSTLAKTLNKVGKITSDVLALYSGAGYEIEGDCYTLSFNAEDDVHEALFRAVCSAHLIVELASIIHNIPLDLAGLVSANKNDLTPVNIPVAGIQLDESAAEDDLIIRRLRFMDVSEQDGQKIISGFEQPFKNLLENQRKQLAKLV
ncbi:hypothetical protein [Teredinibacter sp. KSP-S5-2]|uniref:hypothetical protein n=1 Tax=Teredinibacter sp. KSP-S5-2 TaxID=3034506 RepID=UPI0029349C00|nr:hypothetical protein [Teredinibacter sp. KSP-S5-2]WNO08140.1 hypothetical protein P5V12_14275 [Teredinibacter sp. KSP-S5-2]